MDAAFASRPWPSLTTAELTAAAAKPTTPADRRAKMEAEIERRAKVAAGDTSVMFPAERLRHIEAGGTL